MSGVTWKTEHLDELIWAANQMIEGIYRYYDDSPPGWIGGYTLDLMRAVDKVSGEEHSWEE